WLIYALGASVMWGLTYIINEQLFKKISVISSLSITLLISSLFIVSWAYFSGFLKRDVMIISNSPKLLVLMIASIVIFILAEILINFSIADKNATLASLIEISYPIFVALFSYMIYRQGQMNTGTVLGGILVFVGVGVIYYFNK
ncbi:MAG: EamA family transporter, partial [Chlamydiota bacterium]|nr:EamA family transporter [Chlamydiota bacterium]